MKTSELIKILTRAGCRLIAHGANHDKYYSPLTQKYFVVWRHGSHEIPTGTANAILKAAGLKE